MSIQHKDITETDLHEVKGASTAAVDQYLIADGLGSAAFATKFIKYTVALTPALVALNSSAEQTFTVTGIASATDILISVIKPTAQVGIGIVGWRVTADNTVGITFMNTTAGNITPTAAEDYIFLTYRE